MSAKTVLIVILAGFCLLCGGLIVESGFLRAAASSPGREAAVAQSRSGWRGLPLLQQTTEVPIPPADTNTPAPAQPPQLQPAAPMGFSAIGGPDERVTIGSTDPASGFKYQLVLDSRGAAIRTATFSEFDDRDRRDPQPLTFLTPIRLNAVEVLSLANRDLTLLDHGQRLSLDRLNWRSLGVQRLAGGVSAAAFEAVVVDADDQPILRLTKTYRIQPDTYMLDGSIEVENLSAGEQRVQYGLNGSTGLPLEGGYRMDLRRVVAGYRTPQREVASVALNMKALSRAATAADREIRPRSEDWQFLWVASVSKYFAAIFVPMTEQGEPGADWIAGKWGVYYDPDPRVTGDESLGFVLTSVPTTLAPAGQANSAQSYGFQLYLGPKDKSRFDAVEIYRQLGFVHTIDFMTCCCPASLINPLAFGILAIMTWMYGFIGNYGIVIIILVLIMRLILHPITKKSQIAMHKMSKLAPRAEEIKKKYGNNKAEMNKQMMALYREQGASPIMGFLPMLVQMPVWIALWSAIYTSIDLRGAAFLPFWITDLSAPDRLISWTPVAIPLLGWQIEAFNLLPILMGVAFYLQQKLMPMQQAGAATNPQLAQQQKIMAIMMPLMFPLMLYNAPSGVNLYIMASTFAGVIEQYVIRKHIREREEQESQGLIPATSKTGGKVKKKKPKPFYRFK
jgi:YidC/Oxa1 family membrane protein insertase